MWSHKTRVCFERGNLKFWISVVSSESDERGDVLSSLLFVLSVDEVIRKERESSQMGTEECRLAVCNLNLLDEESKVNTCINTKMIYYRLIKIIYLHVWINCGFRSAYQDAKNNIIVTQLRSDLMWGTQTALSFGIVSKNPNTKIQILAIAQLNAHTLVL